MKERVLIIGAGNWMYGDEAAGIMIANEVGRRFGDLVRVTYDASHIMNAFHQAQQLALDLVIFVAVAEHNDRFPAGSWNRVNFPHGAGGSIEESMTEARNLHVPSLLALGRNLGISGTRVWVYCLAGCDFQLGAPLSFPVKETVHTLGSQIENDIIAELGLEPSQRKQLLSPVAS